MQIEHINENTIRVRMTAEEVEQRGFNSINLIGNRDRVQHLFYALLSEIDSDHTFTKGEPISFQVMPNNQGLDLLITKVNNQDVESIQNMMNSKPETSSLNSGKPRRSFFDLDPDDELKADADPWLAQKETAFANNDSDRNFQNKHAYKFSELNNIVDLADSLRANDLASSIYFYNNQYFLELAFLDENYEELRPADAWAIANEYGIKITDKELKRAHELGKCLIRQDALGMIRYYFDKNKN